MVTWYWRFISAVLVIVMIIWLIFQGSAQEQLEATTTGEWRWVVILGTLLILQLIVLSHLDRRRP